MPPKFQSFIAANKFDNWSNAFACDGKLESIECQCKEEFWFEVILDDCRIKTCGGNYYWNLCCMPKWIIVIC